MGGNGGWKSVLAAGLAVLGFAGGAHAAALNILIVDRDALEQRYLGDDASSDEKAADREALDQALTPVIADAARAAGANLVLDRRAMAMAGGGFNLTPRVELAMDKIRAPHPGAAAPEKWDARPLADAKIVAVDRRAVRDANLPNAYDRGLAIMRASGALFIIGKDALPASAAEIDITSDVLSKAKPSKHALPIPKFAVVDVDEMMKRSHVGQSILAQLQHFTDAGASQTAIRESLLAGQKKVDATLAPIMDKLMREAGANILVDKEAILYGAPGRDVTDEAVKRLDQAMPDVVLDQP